MPEQVYKISQVAELTGLSVDTLRYYERIGLLTNVPRTQGGARRYSEQNLSQLRFIQRAQKMNFSLNEIGELLTMRTAPSEACEEVRQLTRQKLDDIEAHIRELTTLRNELQLLFNLCMAGNEGCAIIEGIEQPSPRKHDD